MSEHLVDVDGAQIRVQVDGRPNSPPLALLSPAGCNSDAWEPVLDRLTGRFRVVRHDYRGTGGSTLGPVGEDQLGFPRFADDAAAVLTALDVDTAVIWGIAFGARVALQFAAAHRRTLMLALFDASVTTPDPPASIAGIERARELRRAAGIPELERDPRWSAHQDQATADLVFATGIRNPHMAHLLDDVAAPTIVATGDCDPNLASSRTIAARLDARLVTMPMTGHISLLERPSLVAAVFDAFVAEHSFLVEELAWLS